jgi:hypothetical protein
MVLPIEIFWISTHRITSFFKSNGYAQLFYRLIFVCIDGLGLYPKYSFWLQRRTYRGQTTLGQYL